MQLTTNFNLIEFVCKDGTPVSEEYLPNVQELANNLQVLRDDIGEPVHINSSYRTPEHNAAVGGKDDSQHLTASAADITTKSLTPSKLAARIELLIKEGKMKEGGVGKYAGFVHVDIRGTKARWKG